MSVILSTQICPLCRLEMVYMV